jgi:hypothetical protein
MSDNVFHDHLDVCDQCRNNPMFLCPEGNRRLHQQVVGQDPGPQPNRQEPDIVSLVVSANGGTAEEAKIVNKIIDDLGFGAVFGR